MWCTREVMGDPGLMVRGTDTGRGMAGGGGQQARCRAFDQPARACARQALYGAGLDIILAAEGAGLLSHQSNQAYLVVLFNL